MTETQLLQQLVDQHQLRPADKYELECVRVVGENGYVNYTGGDDVKFEQLQFDI